MTPPRRKRKAINEPGHAHELTCSCFRRYKSLRTDRACHWLIDAIERARVVLDFDLWAYVFMPEHVHLIVRPRQREYRMEEIMKSIKQPVSTRAKWYLARHAPEWLPRIRVQRGRRVEHHFWQPGGGYDRNITSGRMLHAMIDYVHANPVRRGFVERAVDWPWSSAGWFEEPPIGHCALRPDPIPQEWSEPDGPTIN